MKIPFNSIYCRSAAALVITLPLFVFLAVAHPAYAELLIDGQTINAGETRIQESIDSISIQNSSVEPNGTLQLRAKTGLTLRPGFRANNGSSFAARVIDTDVDNDQMLDSWELQHGLDPSNPGDNVIDSDNDGLSNLAEFQAGANPNSYDTDGDWLSDGEEVWLGIDPTVTQRFVWAVSDLVLNTIDPDGETGWTNVIQDAIDSAVDGDVIYVQDGEFLENIDYLGKRITVALLPNPEKPDSRVEISGAGNGPVVTFSGGEDTDSVLSGFTIFGDPLADTLGILCSDASPRIEDCAILDHITSSDGGGIHCEGNSSPIVIRTQISGNTANSGGAVACLGSSAPIFVNSLLTENSAQSDGGAVYSDVNSTMHLVNCTLSQNTAAADGGAVHTAGTTTPASVVNTIVWNNTAASNPQLYIGAASSTVAYSCIEGGYSSGVAILDQDPAFVDAAAGNFHISVLSPCKEAGTTTGAPSDDIDGQPRPYPVGTGAIDIGADEFVDVFIFTVTTNFGVPIPSVGTHHFSAGEVISPSISFANPGGIQAAFSWAGTGSVSPSGTGATVPPFVISADSTLTWHAAIEYELNYVVQGGGQINGAAVGWYAADTQVSLQAVPDPGYTFLRWTGTVTGSVTSRTITETMDRAHTLTAIFREIPDASKQAGSSSSNNQSSNPSIDQSTNHYILPIRSGWNLVSLPITPLDPTPAAVFPQERCVGCGPPGFADIVWKWHAGMQRFEMADTIKPLTGYWVHYSGDIGFIHLVEGTLVAEQTPSNLKSSWNLTGPANDTPVPTVAEIVPTRVWDWSEAKEMELVQLLHHGRGYWMYAYTPISPVLGNARLDSDTDGMFDIWETTCGTSDESDDSDDDGIDDLTECLILGTDPNDDDTDGDGMLDGWELNNGADPLNTNVTISYDYDVRNRLKSATLSPNLTVNYEYDDADNLMDFDITEGTD